MRLFSTIRGRLAGSGALALVAGLAAVAACGSTTSHPFDPAEGVDSGGAGPLLNSQDVASITIDPPAATITIVNGVIVTQGLDVIAHYGDGTMTKVTSGVGWSVTNVPMGNIASSGLYTPSGNQGGLATATAVYKMQKATAALTVKLKFRENAGMLGSPVQAALTGATVADASVLWAYPYDGTVFPRGIAGPQLMWNNGTAGDAYYVHVTSPTFELESFTTTPPPSSYAFTAGLWQKFVDSTSGAANLTVARLAGGTPSGAATVIAKHAWSIAPASMRGTIYYWSNNVGRVMRIKPGAAAADDFSAGTFGALPASGCTMTCHTVSADGSTLVSGGDTLGGSYDLLKNQVIFDNGGATGTPQKRAWAMPALSPNGKYMVQNSAAGVPGPPGALDGLWKTADGTRMSGSGLDGAHLGMPNFSPDGTKIAYVDVATGGLSSYAFDPVAVKAGASTPLVDVGTGLAIEWPSLTPDANWIIYHRGPLDSRLGNADLFLASATIPNKEVRLAKLDGDTYPFAAADRDKSWNYEPTFAPVPSGGYFWVVFTSRRTYGNALVGAKDAVKQLWVAAIDLAPAPGVDPSHPPFLLPGQDTTSLNMRGFWALDPCKGDGQGCSTGTECCNGACDGTGADGGLICKAGACAAEGDRCAVASDCCDVASGATCINHVCSQPPPR